MSPPAANDGKDVIILESMRNTADSFIDAPKQKHILLRKILPKWLHPIIRGARKRMDRSRNKLDEPYRSIFPFTTAHLIRQQNLVRLATEIDENKIPGAIVECGVLDGGTAALMGYATRFSGRALHLFDAWLGLPATSTQDGNASSAWTGQAVGSPRRVRAALKTLDVSLDRVSFHRGWFDQTFPTANIERIALLHIDADFYEPTKLCLDKWLPRMAPGGYIQFDDYSEFVGCRTAVDECLAQNPGLTLQSAGEHTRAFYIHIPLDYRPRYNPEL